MVNYRNDILLLLDLKSACDACEFELQSLKHRHDVLPLDKQASIPLPGESETSVVTVILLLLPPSPLELVPQTPKKVRV